MTVWNLWLYTWYHHAFVLKVSALKGSSNCHRHPDQQQSPTPHLGGAGRDLAYSLLVPTDRLQHHSAMLWRFGSTKLDYQRLYTGDWRSERQQYWGGKPSARILLIPFHARVSVIIYSMQHNTGAAYIHPPHEDAAWSKSLPYHRCNRHKAAKKYSKAIGTPINSSIHFGPCAGAAGRD